MLKRLAFLCVLPFILGTSAFAQNANDFMNLFSGMMQQAMRQAAQSEWRRLPPAELSCLDQNLRQQGASVDALVSRGVLPSDPRLVQLRSNCRGQVAQGPWPATAQSFPYVVDGLALGGHVVFESEAYKQYHCTPSDKFPTFTWCHKEKTEKTKHGEVTSSNSILHSKDGTAVYVNRYIEPAFFDPNDVRSETDRLSAKFGERAREFQAPPHEGRPNAIIAVWGKIELEQLEPAEILTVASGGSVKGLLISFLGDLQRSAKAGVPVYRLVGGAGFLWAATYAQNGRGVLRFLTVDASQIRPALAENSTAPPTPAVPERPAASSSSPSPSVPSRTDASPSPGQKEKPADPTMDKEDKPVLIRNLPARNGVWKFKFDTDKLTDEERVQAVADVEGTQAKYQLTIACRDHSSELLISTSETEKPEPKTIPWNVEDLGGFEQIRLRIDASPAFAARLNMRGNWSQGQVDIGVRLWDLVHSSRFVISDIFTDDQVEIATDFPTQFTRLCQLLVGSNDNTPQPKEQNVQGTK